MSCWSLPRGLPRRAPLDAGAEPVASLVETSSEKFNVEKT